VLHGRNGLFLLDVPGGTGKTFLITLLLVYIRFQGGIALGLATLGIAAILLDCGRTAHSALKLPLDIHFAETPSGNIFEGSEMVKVLQTYKLIVWDECTMVHKKSLRICEVINKLQPDVDTTSEKKRKKTLGNFIIGNILTLKL